ncbi:MAG: LysM peptidoglycan-binding domain-containing protein [Bacillota bacterium]
MAKLGDIQLLIEKESNKRRVQATEYAVEKGEPFTDHVIKLPKEFKVSGYLLSDNWQADLDKLEEMMNNGKVIQYVGKTSAANVIILDISEDHNESVKNGAVISISLRRIRITKTSWQKAKPKDVPARKPVTNSGKKKPVEKSSVSSPGPKPQYHVMKKGQTYWYLYQKYGTSISQLRAWNKYPDTKIPIGAKLRVK